jgi:hypothetical protein
MLAETVLTVSKNERMPIYAQKEISDFLPKYKDRIMIGKKGKYLNTYQVLLSVKEEADRRSYKLKYVIPIAHPALMPRVKMVAKKLGFLLLEDYSMPPVPFPRDDPQFWVRNPLFFWAREILISYPYFFLKGWI